MSIMNMVANGVYPMGYRGTKTKSLFHFDTYPPHADSIPGNEVLSNGKAFVSSFSKFGVGCFNINYTQFVISSQQGMIMANPFTWEGFMRSPEGSGAYCDIYNSNSIGDSSLGFRVRINGSASGTSWIDYKGTRLVSSILTPIISNQWHHFAFIGNGEPDGVRSVALYFDGVWKSTFVLDYLIETSLFGISGVGYSSSGNFYIDEFRLSNVIRYTGDFTPPTAAFVVD